MRSLNAAQLPWLEVRKEMAEEKGLDPTVADKIGDYVKLKGTICTKRTSLRRVIGDFAAGGPETSPDAVRRYYAASAKEGIFEMGILFRQLDVYRVTPYVSHAP